MIRVARLVAGKDLRLEARSGVLVTQVLPFGVMALVLAGLALGPRRAGHSGAAPGLFYLVVLLVTLLAVARSQSIERTAGTRASVATLGLDPAGVFLGKTAALSLELIVLGVVLEMLAVVTLHVALVGALIALPSVVVTLIALAAAGTLYGALAGEGSGTVTLLPVLALPAFAPLLIAGERAFSAALSHQSEPRWWLITLVALAAYLAVGVLAYGVLEDA